MSITLRDYQEDLVDRIRAAYAEGHQRVMAVLPTAGGKTICFSYIADNAARMGLLTYIGVPCRELIRQTSKSLRDNGIEHGIIAAGYPETDTLIQVVSIQTLVRRLGRYRQPDFFVLDEAHHSRAQSLERIFEWMPDAGALGVTATPARTDGRGFANQYGALVEGPSTAELVAAKWLSEPVLFAPEIPEIDLSDVRVLAGDYRQDELAIAMDKRVITGSAVAHYQRLCPDHPPTVVFCASVLHAQHVAAEFTANGIPFASIDGSMPDEEREDLIDKLGDGRLRGLTSCSVISEGVNIPAVACCILLRPSKSLPLIIQQIGRALRIAPGKTSTLVLDHVNNWQIPGVADVLFGTPNWRQHFLGRVKKSKGAKGETLERCPKCYKVFPPCAICPSCGHALRTAGSGSGREIKEKDGELVRLDASQVLSFKAARAQGKGKTVIKKLERA